MADLLGELDQETIRRALQDLESLLMPLDYTAEAILRVSS